MKSTKLVGDRREDAGMDDAAEPDQTLVDILQDLFDGASPETFEDGMDNHFGIELRRIVQQYGVAATDALEKVMHGANIEVIKESLKQMGYMDNKKTQSHRLALLQRALESPDTGIRDAASVGIGTIRNKTDAIPHYGHVDDAASVGIGAIRNRGGHIHPTDSVGNAASIGIGAIRNPNTESPQRTADSKPCPICDSIIQYADTESPQRTADSKPRMTVSEYIKAHDPERLQNITDIEQTQFLPRPDLLRWARERAGLTQEDMSVKFQEWKEWEAGNVEPTLEQVQEIADTVYVAVGHLFLDEPPEEPLPISDFRDVTGNAANRLSPNLIDTIHACQERQLWYREFACISHQDILEFVSSATHQMQPKDVAAHMRKTLDFEVGARSECLSWTDALHLLLQRADDANVLVVMSGIVIGDNNRRLDINEFRGFALSDPFAPLVFVNGSDIHAVQMFTLAHGLAHIWLGSSALSGMGAKPVQSAIPDEAWCNKVAAEFLVPLDMLSAELNRKETIPDAISRLSGIFKVSTLVVLRRLLDVNWIDHTDFERYWDHEATHLQSIDRTGYSQDSYRHTYIGRRFVRELVVSTLGRQTLYLDAANMLGVKDTKTLKELGRRAGANV